MARPLRIEFPGAVYHVMSRGNACQLIFLNNLDHNYFLNHLNKVCVRFNWRCHTYCLMGNHYHLLIETVDGLLSCGMRALNGVYAQYFNRCHDRVGHLFQGRYKAIIVDRDVYLLELSRYVVRNPVRAGLVDKVDEWKWSSYVGMAGLGKSHAVLTTEWLLRQFADSQERAQLRYQKFVQDGANDAALDYKIKGQLLLGDVDRDGMVSQYLEKNKFESEIPKAQRFASRPDLTVVLAGIDMASIEVRNIAIRKAVVEYGYSQSQVAKCLGLHCSTVSLIVNR